MEKNITKHNHIFAHFNIDELPAIKADKAQYETLMWHIIDGIRLYDLWIFTGLEKNQEKTMWEQVRNHLRYRYQKDILIELRNFICEKAYELRNAIFAISKKDEDGYYTTPLGLGDDSMGDWCKFVVGFGHDMFEDLMNDPDFLRETCATSPGWAFECLTYVIDDVVELWEKKEKKSNRGRKAGTYAKAETETRPADQSFKTALSLTDSFEENVEHVDAWYESEQGLVDGIADGELVKPISYIAFTYPYNKEHHLYFKHNQPTTKHELYKRILAELPAYLQQNAYSAPHAIEDFVIESVDVYQFNDWYAKAYISFGS